jgi:hypothetical protein
VGISLSIIVEAHGHLAEIPLTGASTTTTAIVPATSTTYGAVTFSSPWHYVGNVTLTGALSACEAMRNPCPSVSTSQAEEFTNGTSIIYAESYTANTTLITILISNNAVYCVSPGSNGIAPVCPSTIDGP